MRPAGRRRRGARRSAGAACASAGRCWSAELRLRLPAWRVPRAGRWAGALVRAARRRGPGRWSRPPRRTGCGSPPGRCSAPGTRSTTASGCRTPSRPRCCGRRWPCWPGPTRTSSAVPRPARGPTVGPRRSGGLRRQPDRVGGRGGGGGGPQHLLDRQAELAGQRGDVLVLDAHVDHPAAVRGDLHADPAAEHLDRRPTSAPARVLPTGTIRSPMVDVVAKTAAWTSAHRARAGRAPTGCAPDGPSSSGSGSARRRRRRP